MPKDSSKLYDQLEPSMKRDFLRWSSKQAARSQYSSVANPNHTHNGVDSPLIAFNSLKNSKNYLAVSSITLSSAQIKLLNTTPIILVPAPSARQVIIVDSVTARLTYGGTAYTGTHNLEIHYTNGAGPQCTDSIPAAFINSTSNTFYHAPAVSSSFAPIEGGTGANGQIVAFVNTTNPATGNSTITLVTHYHVASFVT